MAFGFHAGFVDVDDVSRRLSFADRNDDSGEHYFVMRPCSASCGAFSVLLCAGTSRSWR